MKHDALQQLETPLRTRSNLTSHTCRAAAPAMLDRGKGCVVNLIGGGNRLGIELTERERDTRELANKLADVRLPRITSTISDSGNHRSNELPGS